MAGVRQEEEGSERSKDPAVAGARLCRDLGPAEAADDSRCPSASVDKGTRDARLRPESPAGAGAAVGTNEVRLAAVAVRGARVSSHADKSARLRLDGNRVVAPPPPPPPPPVPTANLAGRSRSLEGGATKLADRTSPPAVLPAGVAAAIAPVRIVSRSLRSERRRSNRAAVDSFRSPGVAGGGGGGPRSREGSEAVGRAAAAAADDLRGRASRPVAGVRVGSGPTIEGRDIERRPGVASPEAVLVTAAAATVLCSFCARNSSRRRLSRSAPDMGFAAERDEPSDSSPWRSPSATTVLALLEARLDEAARTVRVELARSAPGDRGGELDCCGSTRPPSAPSPSSSRRVPVDSGWSAPVGGLWFRLCVAWARAREVA